MKAITLIFSLMAAMAAAQTPKQDVVYTKSDTTYGFALITDSLIVMHPVKGSQTDFQIGAVMGAVFVDCYRVAEATIVVRASDGATVPMQQRNTWHYLRQAGTIDETRIMLFRPNK